MKYKCCNLLTGGIEFRYYGVALCQRVDHVGGGDIVVQTYDEKNGGNFKFNIENYLAKRHEIINQNKTGKIYHKCEGCVELREQEWSDERSLKIFQMILHHWTKCNSHCIYCYTNSNKDYYNKRRSYKVVPILKDLDKNELLEYGGICSFAGGEISCLNEFEDVLKILKKYDIFPIFNSSCVKYERKINEYLKNGNGMLIVSVDSGSKELHKKIKQVDTFEKVWKNIGKYAKSSKKPSLIYTKYIILKDINDNEQAITEFLQKSKSTGVKYVLMEIDHYYFIENRDNIPKYIIDLFYYAYNTAEKLGLICQIYSNSSVLLLQGKWANEFWRPLIFDAGIEIDKYSLRSVYKINDNKTFEKYDNIKCAASANNLTYPDIWKACEKSKNNKKFKINNAVYFYAEDIELDNEKLNWDKINKVINKKLF